MREKVLAAVQASFAALRLPLPASDNLRLATAITDRLIGANPYYLFWYDQQCYLTAATNRNLSLLTGYLESRSGEVLSHIISEARRVKARSINPAEINIQQIFNLAPATNS